MWYNIVNMGKFKKPLEERIKEVFQDWTPKTKEEEKIHAIEIEYGQNIRPWMLGLITEIIFRGKTLRQAASELGVSERLVKSFWYENPLCKRLIKDALQNVNLKDVRLRIKASTDFALDVLFEIMNDIGDNSTATKALRAKIALELMTQAGVPEAKEFKLKVEHEYRNLIHVIEEVAEGFEKPKEIEYEDAKFEESGEQDAKSSKSETSSGNAEVSTPSVNPQSFKHMLREATV